MTEPRHTTNNVGIPVASDDHSLTLGANGPILLQDHYLFEKNAQFNRERVVHAKGGGAFGFFEVTDDLSDRNPANYFAEIEQSAFEPSNLVPGIGPSPDKMLLGRLFAYPDTHRYRIGPNYAQLPVNQPKVPVDSYSKDGPMRYRNPGDPVYAPNSYGGPHADPALAGEVASSYGVQDEVVRTAFRLHAEDDDFGQPGTLVREVFDAAARERLVGNVAGHLANGVSRPVLARAFDYWRAIDKETGDKIAERFG